MAHRWYEQGRDEDRGSRQDEHESRRDRFGRGDEGRGTYGHRQFSDDTDQGGYAQGQYARERGRHEQSAYGDGDRHGPGGAGPRGRREHGRGADDERLRAGWESSRHGGRGDFARPGSGDDRWSRRDDDQHGDRGHGPRARDLVGGGWASQPRMSGAREPGHDRGEPRFAGDRGYERGDRGYERGDRGYESDRGYERGDRGSRYGGERSLGWRDEPRYRAELGRRPGGSPWHGDDDRSSSGYGRYGRSGGDYGRFDNDDQDIRVHGGRFKSRDDDDHRYGMGLQGGAGRGRWVTDPRVDDVEERWVGRERGSWGRQVWAEDERYHTRGRFEERRPDDRDDENRFRRTDQAEPWRSHGRSDLDRDRDRDEERDGSPVPWRTGNLGARGWSDRGRDVN